MSHRLCCSEPDFGLQVKTLRYLVEHMEFLKAKSAEVSKDLEVCVPMPVSQYNTRAAARVI